MMPKQVKTDAPGSGGLLARRSSLAARCLLLIVLLGVLALSACQAGGAGGEVAATGGLEVWLDQPPDGSTLPMAPFMLKAHARDVGGPGVQKITFYVNTVPQATVNTDSTLPLVYAEIEWNPSAPGLYEIAAEADNGASRVLSAVAHVCVGDNCDAPQIAEVTPTPAEPTPTPEPGQPTFTPIPSLTPQPTRTTAPTFTPTVACTMDAPIPTSPSNGDAVNEPQPTLSWAYRGNCQPQSWEIDLCSDEACASVITTGTATTMSWSPTSPLNNCAIYYWRVRGVIGSSEGPNSTIFHFATSFPGVACAGDSTAPNIRVPNAHTEQQMNTHYGDQCGDLPTTITFVADVRDDTGVRDVVLNWRYRKSDGSAMSDWFTMTMTLSSTPNEYTATFDNNAAPYFDGAYNTLGGTNGLIEYQIVATDNANNASTYDGRTQIGYCIG